MNNTYYSRKQEIVNSLIHGFGVILGLSCLPILVSMAVNSKNTHAIIGVGVYSFCFLLMFVVSASYHWFVEPPVKRFLKVLDHISIYFLIAGTYTPFILIYIYNSFGITLLCVLWGLSLMGIFFKAFYTGRFELISTIVYIFMGLLLFAGGKRFFTYVPFPNVMLLLVGGGIYIAGAVIYLWDKYTYTHAVWHGFVLVAALCHYVAVLMCF
jgi:hemolysin III